MTHHDESNEQERPRRATPGARRHTLPMTPPTVRVMRNDEFTAVRKVSVAAFAGDPRIGPLLDTLRSSWSWEDALSFVAVRDGRSSVTRSTRMRSWMPRRA